MITTEQQRAVDAAITSRRSIRAFLPTPVAREDVEAILQVAARAPSGTNTQPWKVHVLTGAAKERLSHRILAAYADPAEARAHVEEYAYYPRAWVSPFVDRRRKVGWDLYALLGLTRDNKAGMALDYGMFLQNIMVAARGRGLDTCPQAAFTQFHRIISAELGLPDSEMIVCGMALGYADPDKVENTLVTEREPVSAFARFIE